MFFVLLAVLACAPFPQDYLPIDVTAEFSGAHEPGQLCFRAFHKKEKALQMKTYMGGHCIDIGTEESIEFSTDYFSLDPLIHDKNDFKEKVEFECEFTPQTSTEPALTLNCNPTYETNPNHCEEVLIGEKVEDVCGQWVTNTKLYMRFKQ